MNPTEIYLFNQINGASKEKIHALLLGGAYKFTMFLITAIEHNNLEDVANYTNRVSLILDELALQISHDTSELSTNLLSLYGWWNKVLFDLDSQDRLHNLQAMVNHIAELRAAWNILTEKSTEKPYNNLSITY